MGKSCENLSNVGTKQTFYKKPIASHAIRLEGFSCSHIAFHSCFGDLKSTQSRQTVSHKYKLFVLWYLVTFCKYFGVDGLPPFSRYLRKKSNKSTFAFWFDSTKVSKNFEARNTFDIQHFIMILEIF